jgi:hypothetical protein
MTTVDFDKEQQVDPGAQNNLWAEKKIDNL